MNVIVIIPARGGSKGIPRKNLRPFAGKPLIYHSINTALSSEFSPDVYVSTDDEEIAFFAKSFGAKIHYRDNSLAQDMTTLDPVIFDAFKKISKKNKKEYDIVITLQPTSPLVSTNDLDNAIRRMVDNDRIDTIISAVNDTHLTWKNVEGQFKPNYKSRVNRQQLPPIYKETGGFLITKSSILSKSSRIGTNVDLFELKGGNAVDIDTYEDWNLVEYFIKRKKILFCLKGYKEIGLGHVYNCLILANEVLNHSLIFLVDKKSRLAFEKISESNYDVRIQKGEKLIDDIKEIAPDLIINDVLDTQPEYMNALKNLGCRIMNIEDLGEGSKYADVVVNAIYPESREFPDHYYGPDYFCLRDEFLISDPISINSEVKKIVLTFGGTDPLNLTEKTLHAIYSFCKKKKIEIHVVLGLGYRNNNINIDYPDATIYRNISAVSEVMKLADVAFSSAGRTTYELAALGIPSIIISQNERELTHFFASEENGFKSLGLGINVSSEDILQEFRNLCFDNSKRREMHFSMLDKNIRKGKVKVINLINNLLK